MKKRKKGNLLKQMMAVLLSAVLVVGMAAGAAPTEVLAAENAEISESVSGNDIPAEDAEISESVSENDIPEAEQEESAAQEGAQDAAGGDEPISVSAQDAEVAVSYGLWVNGIQVTDANAANVLGDSTVSYAPDTNVLTLNGANLETEYEPDNYNCDSAVIYADDTFGPLKLNIQGTNTITASGDSYYVSGIFAKGPVEFSGNGSLTVTAVNSMYAGCAVNSYGEVTITGGTCSFTGTGGSSSQGYGMYVGNYGGTVYVNGGTLTTAGAGGNSNVAIAGKLDFSGYANCEVIARSSQLSTPETDYNSDYITYYDYIKVMPWVAPEYDEYGFSKDERRLCQPAVQAEDGYYELNNAGNLYWFAELMKSGTATGYENARLTEDITIPAGMNWKPITVGQWEMPYQGTFDGNGKSISNLSVFRDETEYYDTSASSGLFNTIGDYGVVKNLTMRNASIKVSGSAGAICGTNYGTIENCCNIGGEICVSTTYAGGIAGCNYGKIVRCFNTGTVYAQAQDENVDLDCVGGICGYASEWSECAVIENCYNTGTIGNADVMRAGGVTGGYGTGTKITGCYNIGAVTASYAAEGIGCNVYGSQPSAEDVKNNYYLAETESDDGGRTAGQFASGEVAWLLNEGNTDGTQVYYQTCGEGTPAFTGQTVYQVMSYQCPGDSEGKVIYSNAAGNVTGDHSLGAWTVIKQATENEDGLQERSCVCGYKETEVIPKTGGGKIETDKEQGENTPDADFGTSKDDLIKAVLTPEEQSLVEEGTDVKIILDIDNIDASVSQSDKQAVTDKAAEYKVGEYLDINLYKVIGTDRTKISHTNGKIRIALTIPDSLRNTDSGTARSYAVVRVHDGAAELLPDLDGAADTITIETDQFSTYALVYKDTANTADTGRDNEPKTGDITPIEIYATLAMISCFSYLILLFADRKKGMTEQEKKELTAALVAWGRKGGKLRKAVALAAIFFILVYYHSIGKHTGVSWKQVYGE